MRRRDFLRGLVAAAAGASVASVPSIARRLLAAEPRAFPADNLPDGWYGWALKAGAANAHVSVFAEVRDGHWLGDVLPEPRHIEWWHRSIGSLGPIEAGPLGDGSGLRHHLKTWDFHHQLHNARRLLHRLATTPGPRSDWGLGTIEQFIGRVLVGPFLTAKEVDEALQIVACESGGAVRLDRAVIAPVAS